jgi:Tfp pilus assembly protein PilN
LLKPPIPRAEIEELQAAVVDIARFAAQHEAPKQTLDVLASVTVKIGKILDKYDVTGEF